MMYAAALLVICLIVSLDAAVVPRGVSCGGQTCGFHQKCVVNYSACAHAGHHPCDPIPMCVAITPSCQDITCSTDQVCQMIKRRCVISPCFDEKVPTCVNTVVGK